MKILRLLKDNLMNNEYQYITIILKIHLKFQQHILDLITFVGNSNDVKYFLKIISFRLKFLKIDFCLQLWCNS